MAGQSLEVGKRLIAGDTQAARTNRSDSGRRALRVRDDVGSRNHHLGESCVADRVELRLERARERRGVHAEIGEVHLRSRRAVVVHELEHHAAEVGPA